MSDPSGGPPPGDTVPSTTTDVELNSSDPISASPRLPSDDDDDLDAAHASDTDGDDGDAAEDDAMDSGEQGDTVAAGVKGVEKHVRFTGVSTSADSGRKRGRSDLAAPKAATRLTRSHGRVANADKDVAESLSESVAVESKVDETETEEELAAAKADCDARESKEAGESASKKVKRNRSRSRPKNVVDATDGSAREAVVEIADLPAPPPPDKVVSPSKKAGKPLSAAELRITVRARDMLDRLNNVRFMNDCFWLPATRLHYFRQIRAVLIELCNKNATLFANLHDFDDENLPKLTLKEIEEDDVTRPKVVTSKVAATRTTAFAAGTGWAAEASTPEEKAKEDAEDEEALQKLQRERGAYPVTQLATAAYIAVPREPYERILLLAVNARTWLRKHADSLQDKTRLVDEYKKCMAKERADYIKFINGHPSVDDIVQQSNKLQRSINDCEAGIAHIEKRADEMPAVQRDLDNVDYLIRTSNRRMKARMGGDKEDKSKSAAVSTVSSADPPPVTTAKAERPTPTDRYSELAVSVRLDTRDPEFTADPDTVAGRRRLVPRYFLVQAIMDHNIDVLFEQWKLTSDSPADELQQAVEDSMVHNFALLSKDVQAAYNQCRVRRNYDLAASFVAELPRIRATYQLRKLYLDDAGDSDHQRGEELELAKTRLLFFKEPVEVARMGATYGTCRADAKQEVGELRWSLPVSEQCPEYEFENKNGDGIPAELRKRIVEFSQLRDLFNGIAELCYKRWWARFAAEKTYKYARTAVERKYVQQIIDISKEQFGAADSLIGDLEEVVGSLGRDDDIDYVINGFRNQLQEVSRSMPTEKERSASAIQKKSMSEARYTDDSAFEGEQSSSSAAVGQSGKNGFRIVTVDKGVTDEEYEKSRQSHHATKYKTGTSIALSRYDQVQALTKKDEEEASRELSRIAAPRGYTPYAASITSVPQRLGYQASILESLPNYFNATTEGRRMTREFMERVEAEDSDRSEDLSSEDDDDRDFIVADDAATTTSTSSSATAAASSVIPPEIAFAIPDNMKATVAKSIEMSSGSSDLKRIRAVRDHGRSSTNSTASGQNNGGRKKHLTRVRSVSRSAVRELGRPSESVQRRFRDTPAYKHGQREALKHLAANAEYHDAQRRVAEVQAEGCRLRNRARHSVRVARDLDSGSNSESESDRRANHKRTRHNNMVRRQPLTFRDEMVPDERPTRYINMSGRGRKRDESPLWETTPRDTRREIRDYLGPDELGPGITAEDEELAPSMSDRDPPRSSSPSRTPRYDAAGYVIGSSDARTRYDPPPPMFAAASATPRTHTTVKMETYNSTRMSARAYLLRFKSFCQLARLPPADQAPTFLHYIDDPSTFNEMSQVVSDSTLSPIEQFAKVVRIFLNNFAPNEHTMEANQFKLREMRKMIDENVRTYLNRFEQAYDMAYPEANDVNAKIKEFVNGLDSTMQSIYHRHRLSHRSRMTWQEFKGVIEGLYQTRTEPENRRAIQEHVERSHYVPHWNNTSLDEQLSKEDAKRQPFVNPPVSARAAAAIKRTRGDTSEVTEDEHAKKKQKQQQQQQSSDRQHHRDGQRGSQRRVNASTSVEETSASGAEDDDDEVEPPAEDVKPPRKVRTVTLKSERDSSGGSSNKNDRRATGSNAEPIGHRGAAEVNTKWDPKKQCAGHPNACGLQGHRWERCQRNPKAANYSENHGWRTGAHPSVGSNIGPDTPQRAAFAVHRDGEPVRTTSTEPMSMQVSGRIGKYHIPKLLVDSGAESSLMHIDTWRRLNHRDVVMTPSTVKYVSANSMPLHSLGDITVELTLYDKKKQRSVTRPVTFTIIRDLNCQVLLGYETLRDYFSSIDLRGKRCEFRSDVEFDDQPTPPPMDPTMESLVTVHKGVCLPARSTLTVVVRFESQLIASHGRDVTILCKPIRIYDRHRQLVNIDFPAHICNGKQAKPGQYNLVVTNPSDDNIMLHSGDTIGQARVIDNESVMTSASEVERYLKQHRARAVNQASSSASARDDTRYEQ